MVFRLSTRHKGRWLAWLAVLLITGMLATTALAVPSFTFVADDQGENDEPGQKDLTAQSSDLDNGTFYTAWKWDDTAWKGNNTGDACSLFDTDGDGLVNYAVCATVGGSPAEIQQTRVYSCGDTRDDRCTNPELEGTNIGDEWCSTSQVTGQFGGTDTQSTCNISLAAAGSGSPPPITDLDNATLLNTCSYPSQEPNSDPSDCVLTITNVDTSVGTLSSGTATWSATLNDTSTMNPLTATGSVVFKLWGVNTSGSCSNLIWETGSVTLVNGVASTVGATTVFGSNIITNVTVDADGVYYWTVDYTPGEGFNGSSSPCGEATTITPASVAGASG